VNREQYVEQVNTKLRRRIYELEHAIESALESLIEAREDDLGDIAYHWISVTQGTLQHALAKKIVEEVLDYESRRRL
jgi:hypothetical protein